MWPAMKARISQQTKPQTKETDMRSPQYFRGYVATGDGYTADESPSNSGSVISKDFLDVSGINEMSDISSFDPSVPYAVHAAYNDSGSSDSEFFDVPLSSVGKHSKCIQTDPNDKSCCHDGCHHTHPEDKQCCCTTF
jgi:hypothetical protein